MWEKQKLLKQQFLRTFPVFSTRLGNFLPFNPLPNDEISDLSKLTEFAGYRMNDAKMMIYVFDRVGNIMGKGENAGYQHYLFFQQCFQKPFSSGGVKSRDCVVKS